MLDEHRLTLPPATQPRDDSTRRSEVYSLRQTLERIRGERVRAQWRRWTRRVADPGVVVAVGPMTGWLAGRR